MKNSDDQHSYTDLRLTLYVAIKNILIIFCIGFILKLALCDTVHINSDQMTPTIQHGDQVIISKARYKPPLKFLFSPKKMNPIIYNHPYKSDKKGCLRIAGLPGDHIIIKEGILSVNNRPNSYFSHKDQGISILPHEYSPRDNMLLYRVPKKMEIINLKNLSIRDYIFMYSIIKQENPQNNYELKPLLYLDDSLDNEFLISDFSLYAGKFNAIPDSFSYDFFFWDRLQAYLISTTEKEKVNLTFTILTNKVPITKYQIKHDFYFLISDNWSKGLDSRYFGPICRTYIDGTVIGVLWSFTPDESGNFNLRSRRIGKIIK